MALLPSATNLRRLCFYRYVSVHGGCLPQCMLGYHPSPQEQTPPKQTHPPKQTPPWSSRPPGADTPTPQPPQSRHLPPPRDGHCCRWYTSYWNAFLLASKELTTAKKKLPPVGLDPMQEIITGPGVQCLTIIAKLTFACKSKTFRSLYSHSLLIIVKSSPFH